MTGVGSRLRVVPAPARSASRAPAPWAPLRRAIAIRIDWSCRVLLSPEGPLADGTLRLHAIADGAGRCRIEALLAVGESVRPIDLPMAATASCSLLDRHDRGAWALRLTLPDGSVLLELLCRADRVIHLRSDLPGRAGLPGATYERPSANIEGPSPLSA